MCCGPVAKYVGSLIAHVFGVNYRPSNFEQFWVWIKMSLPHGKKVYAVGLAVVCWAIWRTRNSACFDDKIMKSPTEIVCMIYSFLSYWAGLQRPKLGQQMEIGVETMKTTALQFHHQVHYRGATNDTKAWVLI